MKNALKGLGVGIALTFVWTFFYSAFLSISLIGKLSDFEKETAVPVSIYTLRTRAF